MRSHTGTESQIRSLTLASGPGRGNRYRVNDDTEFRTPWAGSFVRALASYEPPFLGVVGPYCPEVRLNPKP